MLRTVALLLAVVFFGSETMNYPETRKVDQVDDYHGTKVEDPYRWLEDDYADETKAWVEAQNAVTFDYLGKLPQRDRPQSAAHRALELRALRSAVQKGRAVLFLQERRAPEPIRPLQASVFDGGARSAPRPEHAVGERHCGAVRPRAQRGRQDARYGVAESGSDWQSLHVLDVDTGEKKPDVLRWIKFSGASWTHDNAAFSTAGSPSPRKTRPKAGSTVTKRSTTTGSEPSSPTTCSCTSADEPEWGLDAIVSDAGNYAVINVSQGTDERNRVHYLELGDPDQPKVEGRTKDVVRLLDDFDASYDFIGNDGSELYFLTNPRRPALPRHRREHREAGTRALARAHPGVRRRPRRSTDHREPVRRLLPHRRP